MGEDVLGLAGSQVVIWMMTVPEDVRRFPPAALFKRCFPWMGIYSNDSHSFLCCVCVFFIYMYQSMYSKFQFRPLSFVLKITRDLGSRLIDVLKLKNPSLQTFYTFLIKK